MEQQMIIGFDAKRIVSNATGLGSYGRTLVNDLAADVPDMQLRLYAPDEGRPELRAQVAAGGNVAFCHPRHACGRLGKALWRSRGMLRQLRRDGVQVYHGLSGELPRGISHSGIRSVVTIHDLIFMRHPEYYNKVDVKIYTRKFRQAIAEADRIVAISACTRRDICELGGVSPDRVELIYQSCAPRFTAMPAPDHLWQVRNRYDLPDRYLLCVGTIEERKNALLAVEALSWLPDDVALVIVGRPTPYADRIRQHVESERLYGRVVMLTDVDNDALPALYAMADAFVYPSRYEGFGIPIIEAIRMGLPVVACTGSCLEEAGGPDSLYVGPYDAQGMAHAVGQVLYGAPGREERIALSRRYVSRFDNTDAARHFAELYQSLT